MKGSLLKLSGYHGTCTKYRESIDNSGLDPKKVKNRQDHWLGQGVYFFENYEHALWWANDVASKSWNTGSFALIYKAGIEVDCTEVLNLDDNRQIDRFYSYIHDNLREIERNEKGQYPIFDPETARAVYFDYYKIKNGISVIIRTFQKDAVRYESIRSREELTKQKKLARALGVYYREKQICVSKKDCIKTTTIVYNGEEEVI